MATSPIASYMRVLEGDEDWIEALNARIARVDLDALGDRCMQVHVDKARSLGTSDVGIPEGVPTPKICHSATTAWRGASYLGLGAL
jgi:hypothetical protein